MAADASTGPGRKTGRKALRARAEGHRPRASTGPGRKTGRKGHQPERSPGGPVASTGPGRKTGRKGGRRNWRMWRRAASTGPGRKTGRKGGGRRSTGESGPRFNGARSKDREERRRLQAPAALARCFNGARSKDREESWTLAAASTTLVALQRGPVERPGGKADRAMTPDAMLDASTGPGRKTGRKGCTLGALVATPVRFNGARSKDREESPEIVKRRPRYRCFNGARSKDREESGATTPTMAAQARLQRGPVERPGGKVRG